MSISETLSLKCIMKKRMKTYGRHGRYRTVDLYRVEVALYHLSYVPTKNPFIFIAIISLLLSGVALVLIFGVRAGGPATATSRPDYWATPLQRKGLPNLHQVTPTLYRGAQPTAVGMRQLQAIGIKTVLT